MHFTLCYLALTWPLPFPSTHPHQSDPHCGQRLGWNVRPARGRCGQFGPSISGRPTLCPARSPSFARGAGTPRHEGAGQSGAVPPPPRCPLRTATPCAGRQPRGQLRCGLPCKMHMHICHPKSSDRGRVGLYVI